MDGTAEAPAGTWRIRGLPLNHDFIVFAEDASRAEDDPASFPNWIPEAVNTPLIWGLGDNSAGLRDFMLEAYPDAEIVDLRVSLDPTTSPGISDAEVIRLSSSAKNKTAVNFFLSESIPPPNDGYEMTMEITSPSDTGSGTLAISNSQPLQIDISMASDLSGLSAIDVDVSARNTQTGRRTNLDAGLPSLQNWSTTRALLTLAPPDGGLAEGTYTISANLTATVGGTTVELVDESRTIRVSRWDLGSSAISFGANASGDSGGGGGCSFDRTSSSHTFWVLLSLFFSFAFLIRKRKFSVHR